MEGNVAYTLEVIKPKNFWLGSLKGKAYLGNRGVVERLILKWILENWVWRWWIGCI
jgi:hypothetical protein